jgi:hypothetical protein
MTPGEKGVRTQLFHTPPIDAETLLPRIDPLDVNKVYWESLTSWEDVAKQQGKIERVLFGGGKSAAAEAGNKDKEAKKSTRKK